MDDTERANDPRQTLLIGDLIKHLTKWAAIERDERTGNPSFSEGLTLLVACLKRHKSRPVNDLAELRLERYREERRVPAKAKIELPSQLDSLDLNQVSAILDSEHYQKRQLVELGERRLGIPRSKLSRLKREDAIASIRAALDNELSLDAIEHQARVVGERRTA